MRRAWTIYKGGLIVPFIAVHPGIIQAEHFIHVGQEGRGRKMVKAPLPDGTVVHPAGRDGLPTVKEIPGDDGSVVILIRDQSGYRGSWRHREARPMPMWMDVLKKLGKSDELLNPWGVISHLVGADGVVLFTEKPADWKVIATGACAEGLAGRMGGGEELLVTAPFGAAYDVIRSGRTYEDPAAFTIRVSDVGEVTISDTRAEAESALAEERWG